MSAAQVASELGVDRSTVYRWLRLGIGPRAVKFASGTIRIRRRDFIEWAKKESMAYRKDAG